MEFRRVLFRSAGRQQIGNRAELLFRRGRGDRGRKREKPGGEQRLPGEGEHMHQEEPRSCRKRIDAKTAGFAQRVYSRTIFQLPLTGTSSITLLTDDGRAACGERVFQIVY